MSVKPPTGGCVLMVEFFAHGGLLHYSWQLAQALARQAPQTEIVLLTGRDPECGATAAGVSVLPALWTWKPHHRPRWMPARLRRAWRGLRYLAAWIQVLRAARRLRPAVILLGDFEHRCDAWFVRRLRRRTAAGGCQLADIWHNVEAFERNRPGALTRHPRWRQRLARQFDLVFVHGRALARELEALTGVRARIIAHGNQNWIAAQAGPAPDLDRRLQLTPGAPVALLLGSLSEYKGVTVLLQALAQLAPERRPLLVVAGQPTAAARPLDWRAAARRLGLEPWLRWQLHYVPTPEIAWYFRRADLVVLPYLAASQSGVAHLALTFGKPLIVTSAGSLAEVIDGNGLVVKPGDAPALARALERLTGDAGLRRQMGARSLDLALTAHAWDTVARSLLAAWNAPALEPAPAPLTA